MSRRLRAVTVTVAASCVLLAGCASMTLAETDAVEAAVTAIDGIASARAGLSIPAWQGDEEQLEIQHVLYMTIVPENDVAADDYPALLLEAADVLWRTASIQQDLDLFDVRLESSTEEPLLHLGDAIVASNLPAAQSVLDGDLGGRSGSELSACQAWATFGDRTTTPYRSTTQYAVGGCDRRVDVVLRGSAQDLPELPAWRWPLYEPGKAWMLLSFVGGPIGVAGGLLYGRRRARR